MSQLRKDPLSGRWIIIAENREDRPDDYQRTSTRRATRCPFCRGSESLTPPEIGRYEPAEGDSEGWQVRVVPNKYPAVQPLDGPDAGGDELRQTQAGYGLHEVIIESPEHRTRLTQLTDEQAFLAMRAWRDRLRAARENRRIAFALVFKNVGAAAGASLEHIHSQLIAMPIVPKEVQDRLRAARAFYDRRGRCIFCCMLDRQREAPVRLVAQSPQHVAFCPYASRFAYETWILPRGHEARFEDAGEQQLRDLAKLTRETLARLESVLPDPAYNCLIRTAPFDRAPPDHYHWNIEIIPRVVNVAGFEWGSGCYINSVAPEQAAESLRRAPAGKPPGENESFSTRKTS